MHACRRIGGAGPRVTKHTPGRPVSLPCASAIMAAPAFLAAHRRLDGRVVRRVELHGEVAFAGHAEDVLHAVQHELVPGSGRRCGRVGLVLDDIAISSRAVVEKALEARVSQVQRLPAASEDEVQPGRARWPGTAAGRGPIAVGEVQVVAGPGCRPRMALWSNAFIS